MKLATTKRPNLESELIRWGTDSNSSHLISLFYESTVPVVFQSNFLGVDFQSAKVFFQQSQIVDFIDYPMSQEEEDVIFDSVVNQMAGQGYDWGALAYFGLCGLDHRLFKTPFPTKNKWASSNRSLCVEIVKAFPDKIVPAKIKSMELDMIHPTQMLNLIKKELGMAA